VETGKPAQFLTSTLNLRFPEAGKLLNRCHTLADTLIFVFPFVIL
jgi:hypothetical protein